MAENELYNELEDDLRRERAQTWWYGFGKAMVAASVAVIVVTVGVVVWQSHRQGRDAELTSQLIKGIDRLNLEDYKGAAAVFAQAAGDGNTPQGRLMRLRRAEALVRSDDKAGAAKEYALLAEDAGADAAIRNLAAILAMQMAVEPQPLDAARDAPFYYTATAQDGWTLLDQGKRDEAVRRFSDLAQDPQTPFSMRNRMANVLAYLAPEALGSPGDAEHLPGESGSKTEE